MSEYIKRGVLLKCAVKLPEYDTLMVPVYAIQAATAADVAPVVHGKWRLNKDGSGTCNQCHFTQKNVWDMDRWQRYCGVCGALMDGGADNGTAQT